MAHRQLVPGLFSARRSAVSAALVFAAACASGCSSSSAGGGLAPITEIVVPADAITRATGCGAEKGKTFKYAAVVSSAAPIGDAGAPSKGVARGVYDCFVDASFSALPYNADFSATFVIDVVAFDAEEYNAQRAAIDALSDASVPVDFGAFEKLKGAVYSCEATYRLDVASTAQCQARGRR